jgi:hypothetical protein
LKAIRKEYLMESVKLFKLTSFQRLWTIFQKSLSDSSRRGELLVWLDLLRTSEERERRKNQEEDKLNRSSEIEKTYSIKS